MKAKIALISPNLMAQKNDLMTTGIVYMPVTLAYLAGTLKNQNLDYQVIDAFGESPNQCSVRGNFYVRGLSAQQVTERVSESNSVIVIYAQSLTSHQSIVNIIKELKESKTNSKIIIIENSQAVTAYSLKEVKNIFFDLGVDYIVTGNPELKCTQLIKNILANETEATKHIEGVGYNLNGDTGFTPQKDFTFDFDEIPFASWEDFPLKNYWSLNYAHGPMSKNRYLPILTSKGCPYGCRFCVIPQMSNRKWNPKSPPRVVDEIAYYKEKFNVEEFHIEDVDPTVNDIRTKEICKLLINRNLNINWKICAGTKVETLKSEETIELMAKSGCSYVSISPESGSKSLMKKINKPFNFKHAVNLINKMNKVGIYSQACFVLGFPGETEDDRAKTRQMVLELTKNGVDEVAVFIITPVPGSDIFEQFEGYSNFSDLNFSPTWRKDYSKLNRFRLKLYILFLLFKFLYHPLKLLRQPIKFLSGRFSTKMEMAPYRALHTLYIGKILPMKQPNTTLSQTES